MRNRLLAVLAISAAITTAQNWHIALPGYGYKFPSDYFDHPKYETEWWYYTGNLHARDGHRYGFELTFFRRAVPLPPQKAESGDAIWRPDQLYLAHLALSDIDGGTFYHTERLNRAGPGLAGVSLDQQRYWNGNWQVHWNSLTTGDQELQAVCDRFTLALDLKPQKPVVIHGQAGVIRKGPEPDQSSHYISFTRIIAQGRLENSGRSTPLDGLAWMDHEFFTEPPGSDVTRWDWFSIQLNNGEELMLYRLRDRAGNETPYSSGTYVDAQGKARFLDATQFSLKPGETWRSPDSGATYPIVWTIDVPSLHLQLSERTDLKNQELFTKGSISPVYWEGAVSYSGQLRGQAVKGVGYLEMTGYSRDGRPTSGAYK
jgi:predicted secreted hydrolase